MTAPALSIRKLKVADPPATRSLAFEAVVYVGARPFCRARGNGRGGPIRYLPLDDQAPEELAEQIRQVGERLDPKAADSYAEAVAANRAGFMSVDQMAVDDWLAARREGRVVRTGYEVFDETVEALVLRAAAAQRLRALMNERLVFKRHGKKALETSAAAPKAVLQRWLADKNTTAFLKAEVILNREPFEEALDLYLELTGKPVVGA